MGKNLAANWHFRLNEDSPSANDGKIYVFVKLTDSCSKAIENAVQLKRKSSVHAKSTIKFNKNGGVRLTSFRLGQTSLFSLQGYLNSDERRREENLLVPNQSREQNSRSVRVNSTNRPQVRLRRNFFPSTNETDRISSSACWKHVRPSNSD